MSSKAIIIPNAERVKTGRPGYITFFVGESFHTYLRSLFKHQEIDRRAPSKYYYLKIDTPRKPRTTGKESQNTHVNGHAQQIAMETGQPFEDVKKRAKQGGLTMGYPILQDENGPVLDFWGEAQGISEADCSTEEAAILIEALHLLAAELEIDLIEK